MRIASLWRYTTFHVAKHQHEHHVQPSRIDLWSYIIHITMAMKRVHGMRQDYCRKPFHSEARALTCTNFRM